jgi:hypothetical protein
MRSLKLFALVSLIGINLFGMEIVGKIKVKGTSPHTYLVIEDIATKKSYMVKNQEKFDLINRQNETLKVKAKILQKAIGAGFPAVIEILEIIK